MARPRTRERPSGTPPSKQGGKQEGPLPTLGYTKAAHPSSAKLPDGSRLGFRQPLSFFDVCRLAEDARPKLVAAIGRKWRAIEAEEAVAVAVTRLLERCRAGNAVFYVGGQLVVWLLHCARLVAKEMHRRAVVTAGAAILGRLPSGSEPGVVMAQAQAGPDDMAVYAQLLTVLSELTPTQQELFYEYVTGSMPTPIPADVRQKLYRARRRVDDLLLEARWGRRLLTRQRQGKRPIK